MNMETNNYQAHEAANAFPMMDEKRFDELKADIKANGQKLPIVICDGKILDGRNRAKACMELGIKPIVEQYDGDPWGYVWSLNGTRRDLVAEQRYLIWKHITEKSDAWQKAKQRIADEANRKRAEAAREQENRANQYTKPKEKPEVKKMEVVGQSVLPPAKTKNEPGKQAKAALSKTNAGAVARGDKLAKDRPDLAKKVMQGEIKPAEAYRQMRRDEVTAKLNDVAAIETKKLEGKYDVIVIDPPWPMEKIERDVTPNQVAFEYPTMAESELSAMKMPAADNCHMWLWTTHKFLPMALRLLPAWGFKYVCCFTWHKPGGFQPFNLPQYNCEFALYARKGTPEFIDTKAFPTCFNAPRGAHSEKPELFYDMVRRVTAGARIDIFNRRKIDGFDVWGKEAAQ